MQRRFLVAAACTLVIGLAGAAQAKPNFSGDWKLNAAKSDFGPMPAPDKMDRKITHEDPSLKYSTTQVSAQGEFTAEMSYTTDGKSTTNKTPRGEVTGSAKWDGDVLAIGSKRELQGMEITQNERWSLSADGKALTVENKINTPQGDFEIKIVLDKQ